MTTITRSFALIAAAVALATLIPCEDVAAQPPRSGGFDFTYGAGTSTGAIYKNRKGTLSSFEILFSTRMDGTNSPLLMGATISYFAQTDPTDGATCVPAPQIGGCAPNYPDLALAGLMAAFEPNVLPSTFFHLSVGGSFVQPSSSGGPTVAAHGAAKVGQSFGRHLALLVGARALIVPDLRGFSATLTTYAVTLRVR